MMHVKPAAGVRSSDWAQRETGPTGTIFPVGITCKPGDRLNLQIYENSPKKTLDIVLWLNSTSKRMRFPGKVWKPFFQGNGILDG